MAGSEGGRKSKGKQKVEMKMIEKEQNRTVTFSKRKSGIYKKATELAALTGSEIAVMVYSGKGKPFTFGTPSFEKVMNRFQGKDVSNDITAAIVEAHKEKKVKELSKEYNKAIRELEEEKKRFEKLRELTKGVPEGVWTAPVDKMNKDQVFQMAADLMELRPKLLQKIKQKNSFSSGASASRAPLGAEPTQVMPNAAVPNHAPFANFHNLLANHSVATFPPSTDGCGLGNPFGAPSSSPLFQPLTIVDAPAPMTMMNSYPFSLDRVHHQDPAQETYNPALHQEINGSLAHMNIGFGNAGN